MKKKVYLITQSKGGSGKSACCFTLAMKYPEAVILDLDDATTTTMTQLKYRNPLQVKFLDPITQRIDRSAFNGFFESIALANKEIFIADLGASVAETLPKYLEINSARSICEILMDYGIDLQILCVIGGANNFSATMRYLSELVDSVNGHFVITAVHNKHFPFSDNQFNECQKFIKDNELRYAEFDLIKDKVEIALRTASDVLQAGKGLEGLSPFKALYFKGCIDSLDI